MAVLVLFTPLWLGLTAASGFGEGRFGPAVRVEAEDVGHHWVFFPLDGLIPSDEFTIEFHARSDTDWSDHHGCAFWTVSSHDNLVDLRIDDGCLQWRARGSRISANGGSR